MAYLKHPASADGAIPSFFARVLHEPISLTTLAMSAGASASVVNAAAVVGSMLPALSTIGTIASVGGALVSGLGSMQQGKAAKVNANFQAKQMEQQAGQDRASAQRVAIEKRREANVAMSNAQARAAASGGGATDPTVLNITGQLAQQGEYNALSALFSGEERARGQELQAKATRMEGKQAKKAGMIGGVSTIASGVGNTLMAKYSPASSSTNVAAHMGPYYDPLTGRAW